MEAPQTSSTVATWICAPCVEAEQQTMCILCDTLGGDGVEFFESPMTGWTYCTSCWQEIG